MHSARTLFSEDSLGTTVSSFVRILSSPRYPFHVILFTPSFPGAQRVFLGATLCTRDPSSSHVDSLIPASLLSFNFNFSGCQQLCKLCSQIATCVGPKIR